MDLDMVLNDLSISSPAPDIDVAKDWMSGLISTARTASEAGVRRVLRTNIDINNTLLAESYPLSKWRNDKQVDREIIRYFRVLVAQYPPLDDLPEVEDQRLSQDFFYGDETACGFGIAYLIEGLAVSFQSHQNWNQSQLEIKCHYLNEDDELDSRSVWVKHASQPQHVEYLSSWIENRLSTGVASGEDLWNRRTALFPSLVFCEHLQSTICSIHDNNPLLRQIIKRLFEIQNYCHSWGSGPFSLADLPFRATGDSSRTLEEYREERTFLCPDGEERTFSLHCRLTPLSWRVYFDPSIGPGRMIIGHIGPHLRTAKFHN